MDFQSDICLSSSLRGLGGKKTGLVLLLTFSKALGPERVGLWVEGLCGGRNCDDCGADDDDGRGAECVVDVDGEGDGTGVGVLLWMSCRTGCGGVDLVGVGRD
jgi:hypothetical protein